MTLPPGQAISPDDRRHLLMVQGSPAELRLAQDTIRVFDIDQLSGSSIALVPLSSAEPPQMADELRNIFAATRRWMDPDGDGNPADGIDGWRLDAAPERPVKFWADWNAYVQKLNPSAYTSCEVWSDASKFMSEGGFSACMNYYAFAIPVKGFLVDTNVISEFIKAQPDSRVILWLEDADPESLFASVITYG